MKQYLILLSKVIGKNLMYVFQGSDLTYMGLNTHGLLRDEIIFKEWQWWRVTGCLRSSPSSLRVRSEPSTVSAWSSSSTRLLTLFYGICYPRPQTFRQPSMCGRRSSSIFTNAWSLMSRGVVAVIYVGKRWPTMSLRACWQSPMAAIAQLLAVLAHKRFQTDSA